MHQQLDLGQSSANELITANIHYQKFLPESNFNTAVKFFFIYTFFCANCTIMIINIITTTIIITAENN